jgi:site-specific recombinase XerD
MRRIRERLPKLLRKQRPHTITRKLAVVRSFYEYLRSMGIVAHDPAATNLAPPPALPEEQAGKALKIFLSGRRGDEAQGITTFEECAG